MKITFIQTGVMKYRSNRVNRRAYVQIWDDGKPLTDKSFDNLTSEQYGRFQALQNRIAASDQASAIYAENDGSPDEIVNGTAVWN
jgi:hypothetical protein